MESGNHPQLDQLVDFHGHLCPGLAIGYRATMIALERLKVQRARDEELIAIVENDSCSADAVQYLAGATFGKGNFFFRDWGKQVFTFARRGGEKAVRVALKWGAFKPEKPAGQAEVLKRLKAGTASSADRELADQWRQERIEYILSAPEEDLFDIRDVELKLPAEASIMPSVRCDECGEPVMETRATRIDDSILCMECAGARG